MASRHPPPLDEIQWHGPAPQGIHSNSVLWYFADSPFFDPTSNNAVVINQGLSNLSMQRLLETREAFEGRLRSMSGLEFVVAQEPAEMAPGTGTGVWVIRKQTRRKRPGQDDEITVHAAYFIVGENIYMAPTLGDILSSRVATISSAISKIFPVVDGLQKWSPGQGRTYKIPASAAGASRAKGGGGGGGGGGAAESKEPTPMPEGPPAAAAGAAAGGGGGGGKAGSPAPGGHRTATAATAGRTTTLDARLAEESLAIHLRYGGEYMDENPIAGQPGSFHFSSTGRKDKLAVPLGKQGGAGAGTGTGTGSLALKDAPPPALPALNTKAAAENPLAARAGKETKSPKSPGAKLKRRKSKTATSTPS